MPGNLSVVAAVSYVTAVTTYQAANIRSIIILCIIAFIWSIIAITGYICGINYIGNCSAIVNACNTANFIRTIDNTFIIAAIDCSCVYAGNAANLTALCLVSTLLIYIQASGNTQAIYLR